MGKAWRTVNKVSDKAVFRELVPLNSLSDEHFMEISKHIVVEDVSAGRYLFGEGDHDNRSVYLLDGKVNFVDASGRVTGVVNARTDPARYPLANQQPRLVSARVASRSIIATIDSTLLDVLLTFDQTSASKTVNVGVQAELDVLLTRFKLYVHNARRLEEACDDARQARMELEGDMEKLKTRFARPLSLK
jgi:hypothetical protein